MKLDAWPVISLGSGKMIGFRTKKKGACSGSHGIQQYTWFVTTATTSQAGGLWDATFPSILCRWSGPHALHLGGCWDQNSMSFQMCKHKEFYFNYFQDPLISKVSLGMNHDSFPRSPKSRWWVCRRWQGHLPSRPAHHQPTQRSGRGACHGADGGSRNSGGRVSKFQEGTPHGSLTLVQETSWNFSVLKIEVVVFACFFSQIELWAKTIWISWGVSDSKPALPWCSQRRMVSGRFPLAAAGRGGGDLFFLVWGGLSRVCLWRCGRLPEGINHCQTAQRRCQTPVPCAVYSFLAVSVLGGHVFYWYEDSIESGMCPIENSVWTCVDHWMIECFRLVIGWKWRCCPRSCKSSGSY